jgi:hypothetical protein
MVLSYKGDKFIVFLISDVVMELGGLHGGCIMYIDNVPFKIQTVI